MEVITDGRSRREMEQRLNTLQTSLNVVETSIMKFENLLEDCQMVEEEVGRIEEDEAHQEEEEEEETTDVEMVTRKSMVIPSPLAPIWRPIPRTSLHWSPVEIPSPLRRKLSSCSKHLNLRIQRLDLTAPGARPARSWEGWLSYASHP